MKWEPIETAEHMKRQPDDPQGWRRGPSVLLWVKGDFYVGFWDPETYCSKPRPHWHYRTHMGARWMRENQPTHWMLPSPPDAGGQIEEPALAGDEVDPAAKSAGLTHNKGSEA